MPKLQVVEQSLLMNVGPLPPGVGRLTMSEYLPKVYTERYP